MAGRKLKLFGVGDSITFKKGARWGYLRTQGSSISDDDYRENIFHIGLLRISLFVGLGFFILRLFQLTVVDGNENRVLADENRIRLVEVEAPRGKILDRDGKILAQSMRIYRLKNEFGEEDISADEAKRLELSGAAGENFVGPQGRIISEVKRSYLLGEAGAHIYGYTSLVQKEDLVKKTTLSAIDHVGRLGVEDVYDDFLRGVNGKKILEVDAVGRKVSILGEEQSKGGQDLTLTIDASLQTKTYEVLRGHAEKSSKKGAIVIENPATGEILALASYPSFDPSDIGKSVSEREKPFFNRVTQGEYPPGSVFKINTALAGLEGGEINANSEIEDVGEFFIGEFRFPNWYFISNGKKEGILKVTRAIARSNDIFFYRVAERVGIDSMRSMANKLGFGQKTGIDLPGEALGLVPSATWKESVVNTGWFLGDTMHLGIGQGFMLSTPIQVSQMSAFVASGKLMKPYLVSGIGEKIIEPKVVGEHLVKNENLQLVREGMKQACEKGGTGWPFFDSKYKVGCKTGTAEKSLGNPHAWFTAFAPYDNPTLSITVLIEEGGEGSTVAGPVAKEILDWWFLKKS